MNTPSRLLVSTSLVALGALLGACAVAPEAAESSEGALAEPPPSPPVVTCPRPLAPPDRERRVVVSHPFGDNPNRYEVLRLSSAGELSRAGVAFEMGRGSSSVPIVFTPDGEIGLAPQDDGTIGVFRLADGGERVEVVDAHWTAGSGFYARSVTMDPSGARAYAVSANSPEHGGGVYEIAIGCDGRLVSRGLVVPSGPAHALSFLPSEPGRAVLYGGTSFASSPTSNTFLLDLSAAAPALVAEGDGFGDMQAIVSSVGVTFDGKYALVGDDGLAAGDRVAVVALPSMKSKQVLSTRAPFSIVTSPWNNAAIVVNGDSADEITALRYDASNTEAPFSITGPVTSKMPGPLLPGVAQQITRGQLIGRVLVVELVAVRQLQFGSDGAVAEVDKLDWPMSIADIVGSLGVQP